MKGRDNSKLDFPIFGDETVETRFFLSKLIKDAYSRLKQVQTLSLTGHSS